jgi:hypothetical protein
MPIKRASRHLTPGLSVIQVLRRDSSEVVLTSFLVAGTFFSSANPATLVPAPLQQRTRREWSTACVDRD